jgi:hypothetical protein
VNEDHEVDNQEDTYLEEYSETLTRREKLRQWGGKVSVRALTIEARYLSLLRYSMLVVATGLLIGAIGFVLMGAIKQLGSSQVSPEPVQLTAADIAPEIKTENVDSANETNVDKTFKLSDQLKRRTLAVYKANFAKFERKDDKVPDRQIVDIVWPKDRRNAFDELDVNYINDEGQSVDSGEDLARHALDLVEKSVITAEFTKSLQAYKAAQKADVCRNEERTRQRTVSYWDTYSTECSDWFYSPYGCSSTRTVSEPYTEKVCKMQFPSELDAPANLMAQAVDRFLSVSEMRQTTAAYEAEEKEAEVTGRGNLLDGGKIFIGFLGLMFLYLLVVIERHHRLLRRLVKADS